MLQAAAWLLVCLDSVVGGSSRDDSYKKGLPILEMSAPVYLELDDSGFQESWK